MGLTVRLWRQTDAGRPGASGGGLGRRRLFLLPLEDASGRAAVEYLVEGVHQSKTTWQGSSTYEEWGTITVTRKIIEDENGNRIVVTKSPESGRKVITGTKWSTQTSPPSTVTRKVTEVISGGGSSSSGGSGVEVGSTSRWEIPGTSSEWAIAGTSKVYEETGTWSDWSSVGTTSRWTVREQKPAMLEEGAVEVARAGSGSTEDTLAEAAQAEEKSPMRAGFAAKLKRRMRGASLALDDV